MVAVPPAKRGGLSGGPWGEGDPRSAHRVNKPSQVQVPAAPHTQAFLPPPSPKDQELQRREKMTAFSRSAQSLAGTAKRVSTSTRPGVRLQPETRARQTA